MAWSRPTSLITRCPPWVAAVLGVLLLAPALFRGPYVDDYLHQLALMEGSGSHLEPWALYDFGTQADWDAPGTTVGRFPWWTAEDWAVRFLRPGTSLYLWFLHGVFGPWIPGYVLVGLGLFALLVLSVHGLFVDLNWSPAAARAGTLVFALCDSAVLPAGWPANANSLLAALFGVLALRGALGPAPPTGGRLALTLVAAAAAALCKESGFGVLVLVAAALAWRRRGAAPALRRTLAGGAAAAVALALGHATWFVLGGYGTHSLFYATPWADPLPFARNLTLFLAVAAANLTGPYPVDAAGLFPELAPAVGLVGLALGLPILIWMRRAARGVDGAVWLGLWTLGLIALQAGALPADRLFFAPAVGFAGLLGLVFARPEVARGPWARRALEAACVLATVGSGGFLLVQGAGLTWGANYMRAAIVATEVGPPESGHRDLFVLQTENQITAFSLVPTWAFEREDHDLNFWKLQHGRRALRWTRSAEDAFELESLDEPFLTGPFEKVYLTEAGAIEVGQRWQTPRFEVEALEVDGGWPTRLAFRLGESLEAPGISFLIPVEGVLRPIAPPAIGTSVELEAPARHGPYAP